MTKKSLIIAEAGVNHNGDIGKARELVLAAAEAGADTVKFQTFSSASLVTSNAEMAKYQKANTKSDTSQQELLKKLELKHDTHFELKELAEKNNVSFLSTAFEDQSLDFLWKEMGATLFKIPSGEITNGPFILRHARTKGEIILSTGMSNLKDIKDALAVLAYGMVNETDTPTSIDECYEVYNTPQAQKMLKSKVSILHCTTEYPAPFESVNLNAMNTLKEEFGCRVGYSDHTDGIAVSLAAVAMGAEIIEKHFTLDKTLPGPDHKASLEPDELTLMVKSIREIEQSMGNGVKEAHSSEVKNITIARKSIVASKPIKAGELFSVDNLAIKRPGNGTNPMNFWTLIGTKADKDYQTEELI